MSMNHEVKGNQIKVEFKPTDDKPPQTEADSDEEDRGPVKIEVKNAPKGASIDAVKTFFEMPAKSGGCKGAVVDIKEITEGVFHVTFHDHSG